MALSSSQISSSDLDTNSLYLTSDGKLLYNTSSYIGGVEFKLNNATIFGSINVLANTVSLIDNTTIEPPFVSPNNYDSGNTYILTGLNNVDISNGSLVSYNTMNGMTYTVTVFPGSGISSGHGILAEMTFNEGIVSDVYLSDIVVVSASDGQASVPLSFTIHTAVNNVESSIILPSQSGRNGFLSKSSVSLNGILYSKNASPFKTNTVPQGSDFSLNRFQFRKNVSAASKGIDASTRTQMLRIKAQKPSSIATNVAQSYKNVKTTYKDVRFALSRVRR